MPDTREPSLVAFGKALRQHRTSKKMTQVQLGEELGVGQVQVSNYEQGLYEPPVKTVFTIEQVLGLRGGELSKFLGYRPAGLNRPAKHDVISVIMQDARLDKRSKDALVNLYNTLTGSGTMTRRARRSS